MANDKRIDFSILELIESQQRNADPTRAKRERGLVEMTRQAAPVSATRPGCPIPTTEMLRDLQLTVGTDGAALAGAVSNPMAQLAGAARPALVLEQAGVAVVQINDGQEGRLPRWRGNGGGWIQEGDTLAEVPLTLSSVEVSAKHCGAHVNYSRRLRLGTDGDLQARIVGEMRRVVRQQLESGFLTGTGTAGQPIGLLSQASGSVGFASAIPAFAELVEMLEVLGDADGNISGSAWLLHPSMLTALANTERSAGSGSFCVEPMGLRQWHCSGLPVFPSSHVPEDTVVLMDPAAVSLIYFGPPQLLVDPFSGSNSVTGTNTVIVSNYADLAVSEPALVVVGSA